MAKNNRNLPDYNHFNKAKGNTKYRLIIFGVLSLCALVYLIAYSIYLKQNPTAEYNHNTEAVQSDTSEISNPMIDDAVLQIKPGEPDGTDVSIDSDTPNHSSTSEENTADDAQDTDISGTTDDPDAYDKETEPQKEENVMYSEARCLYQEGFFYQPLTEDVIDRIYGLSYKTNCTVPYEDLRYVSVLYKDFNNETQTGEIVCNKAIAQDLVEIFYELYRNNYQIDKIRLVDEYNADDDLSCADNNTSCFNFRVVEGTTSLSKHALGLAIDINPFQNPYVTYPNGKERISPPGSEPYADRSSGLPHIITESDLCYQLFKQHGFTWGGHWKSLKDYQHFQKEL